jgi:CubicO group peptidase (beta-lactamase class C family)
VLKIIIFLQIALFGVFTPAEKPLKPLAKLSNAEINILFQEANKTFKSRALEAELDSLCNRLNGSVMLAFGDDVFYKKEVGFTRLAKKIPANAINAETLFELASISKQFTAAAILKLNEEKKLSLNDDVSTFLPNFPYKNITLHHLLTHTSGLPEYMDFPEKDFNQKEPLSNARLEEYLETKKPKVLFQPGAKFKYVNTNYALLALIVEKITAGSFTEYVKKEIFAPAGLKLTCFTTALETQTNYAKGHLEDMSERPFHFQNGVLGDKGVYSTVDELYRWVKAYLRDYKVLPQEVIALATQPQNQNKEGKPSELYGYGYRLEEDNDEFLIYHGGLWRGFQNNMVYRPKDQYIFIVLSNFRNKAPLGVNGRLLEIIDGA